MSFDDEKKTFNSGRTDLGEENAIGCYQPYVDGLDGTHRNG